MKKVFILILVSLLVMSGVVLAQSAEQDKDTKQKEYIKKWEEKWKRWEDDMAKRQLSSIKEEEMTEKKKSEILERNRKLFKNTKWLNLIAELQRRYHKSNGKYADDFGKLNFLDSIEGVVSENDTGFTIKDGTQYSMDEEKVIATKPQEYVIKKYYKTGNTICQDDNGSCSAMGIMAEPKPKHINYIHMNKGAKGTPKKQGIKQKQIDETRQKNIDRMNSAMRNNIIMKLVLINKTQDNYYREHGTYTDDFNKLNNFINIEGVVSKGSSAITTKEGIIYSISKDKDTATKPQEYMIEIFHATNEIICKDISKGSCEKIGLSRPTKCIKAN